MPRIAAAMAVVVTLTACIAVNSYRYPVVREMVAAVPPLEVAVTPRESAGESEGPADEAVAGARLAPEVLASHPTGARATRPFELASPPRLASRLPSPGPVAPHIEPATSPALAEAPGVFASRYAAGEGEADISAEAIEKPGVSAYAMLPSSTPEEGAAPDDAAREDNRPEPADPAPQVAVSESVDLTELAERASLAPLEGGWREARPEPLRPRIVQVRARPAEPPRADLPEGMERLPVVVEAGLVPPPLSGGRMPIYPTTGLGGAP